MVQKAPETIKVPTREPGVATYLFRVLRDIAARANDSLQLDGSNGMRQPARFAEYTVVTRPTAADWEGGVIYVSDGAAGAKFQGSDGANWVNLG